MNARCCVKMPPVEWRGLETSNVHSKPFTARRCAFGLVAVLALATVARSQYVPETEPRPGEQRLTAYQFKATHNSFERSETLDEQMDTYNVWMLELDCFWDESAQQIYVEHYCGSPHVAEPLINELVEIGASLTKSGRFTIIYLDMHGAMAPCYDDWPAQDTYRAFVQDEVESILGADRIYTPLDFNDIDSQQWPSYQELARRGKNFAVFATEYAAGGNAYSDWLFNATGTNPPEDSFRENIALVNLSGGCDMDTTDAAPDLSATSNPDRWLFRAYPGTDSLLCDLCSEQDGNYWDTMIDRGFNFIASNCVSDEHTFDSRLHSPAPMYVFPFNAGDDQYGTLGLPFGGAAGLQVAFNVVSPMVDIRIWFGTYDLPVVTTINRPMVLTASGGDVTIQ